MDVSVLAEMAKADGDKHFAPYWRLYLEDNPLNAEASAHIESLKQAGVRVTTESVSESPDEEPGKDSPADK